LLLCWQFQSRMPAVFEPLNGLCRVQSEEQTMTNGNFHRWKSIFLSVVLLFSTVPVESKSTEQPYDIVITNGHIIDGTGSPWYSGDLAIRDGKIAAIGNLHDAARSRTIDARGQVVAPGFIDMLGQSEQMREIVRQAMRDGAVGVSTSLEYAPAPYAKTEELIALAAEASRFGGIYATHMRNEGTGILAAIDEALRIGREARIPVEIWHLKVGGKPSWGHMPEVVAKINAARAQGLDVTADTYAYTAWFNDFSAFIPAWAHNGGNTKLIERLKDPATRARIRTDMLTPSDKWDNEWQEIPGPEAVLVGVVHNSQLLPLQGKTLAEIAKTWNKEPMDALFDLLIEDHGLTSVAVFGMSEPDVSLAL